MPALGYDVRVKRMNALRPVPPGTLRAAWTLARDLAVGPRAAVWAIETCADPSVAAASLLTDAHLAEAERLDAFARANPDQVGIATVERRAERLARLRAFADLRASAPSPPLDLAAWARDRVGVDPDGDARVRGPWPDLPRPAWRGHFVARATPDGPYALANACALAADLFPIDDTWEHTTRDDAVAALTYEIGHDLAYRSERVRAIDARTIALGFVDAYAPNATLLVSFRKDGDATWSSPVTTHTFSRGFAIVDGARGGVIGLGGED